MRIEHVAMYVFDLEKSKQFFVRYLGGQASDQYTNPLKGFSSFFISFENGARLELMNKTSVNGHTDRDQNGYAHIAFSVGSKEHVDQLTEKLRMDGYSIASEPRTTGDGYYESCVADAEGNLIEITV